MNEMYARLHPRGLELDGRGELVDERIGDHPDGVMALETYLDTMPPES